MNEIPADSGYEYGLVRKLHLDATDTQDTHDKIYVNRVLSVKVPDFLEGRNRRYESQ